LILAELHVTPPDSIRDEFDFFRGARSARMPSGLWDRIMPVMQLTRPRMVQLLNILQLPTHQLELADRYRLPERVLREILALPPDQWERMIHLSIQNNLTSEDIYEASTQADTFGAAKTSAAGSPVKAKKPAYVVAVGGLRRFANIMRRMEGINQVQAFDEVADDLVTTGDAQSLLSLLDELSSLIKARLNRK